VTNIIQNPTNPIPEGDIMTDLELAVLDWECGKAIEECATIYNVSIEDIQNFHLDEVYDYYDVGDYEGRQQDIEACDVGLFD